MKRRQSAPSSSRATSPQKEAPSLPGRATRYGNAFMQEALAKQSEVAKGGPPAGAGDATGGGPPEAPPGLPFGAEMARAFGEDFSGVRVRFGGAAAAAASAVAVGDTVTFDKASPTREQVAHELAHVVQQRRFGAGEPGLSGHEDASEREARTVATQAARGEPVEVRAAPAAEVQRDDEQDDPAARIYANLHGWIDDEAGALGELLASGDVGGTCATYAARYGVKLWTDFIGNASGDTLTSALAALWSHMSVLDRLETNLGFDDDEDGILQVIDSASDAELQAARGGIQPYLDELSVADQYKARVRIWPEDPIGNVLWLLENGDGYLWDDEGPAATAILSLSPQNRKKLWDEHQDDAFGMYNATDKARVQRMCVGADGAATDAEALEARMELATEGLGTDEDGVVAAVGMAGSRRDELACIEAALQSGTGPDGLPLTAEQRAAYERRRAELGDMHGLLSPTTTADGALVEDSFLGRVQGDMDAGTTDAALTSARVSPFERARQALLATIGWVDVDEAAALAILRGIQGELVLEAGESIDSLSAEEVRRRCEASAAEIRAQLRADEALAPVWNALDADETAYAEAMTDGDTYAAAIHELTEAYEGVDSDEAAIVRILRELPAPDRQRLATELPPIIGEIRGWYEGDPFLAVFEAVLSTGQVPATDALEAAYGGGFDGTNTDLADAALASLTEEERAKYRRGYLLAHTDRAAGAELSQDDADALSAYEALYARMRSEYSDEELDLAIHRLIGLPSLAEVKSGQGRIDAAAILFARQRERLDLGGALTDLVSTTDDTAEAAHVEFASRYTTALEDGEITLEEFAVLVALDQQFNQRFGVWSDTANLLGQIAGTVAAVVFAAVAIVASGGAVTAATPGIVGWLSANSTVIASATAAGALGQVAGSEAFGGDMNEMTGTDGAQQALVGAINGAMMVAGAALAERAANLVGLSGRALTAEIARAAAGSTEAAVGGKAFARGALTGLIDGSLGGAVGELAMTLTDAETWKRSVWEILGRAGTALLRGGLLGGASGAAVGSLLELATMMIAARGLRNCTVEIDEALDTGARIDFSVSEDGTITDIVLRFGKNTPEGDIAAHVDTVVSLQRAGTLLARVRAAIGEESFPPGTAAGNAAEELPKIDRMIQDRLRQLRGSNISPETREILEAELDVLEANVEEFADVLARGDLTPQATRIGRPDAPPGYPDPPAGHYYCQRNGKWDIQRYPDADVPPCTLAPDGPGKWKIVSREGAPTPSVKFPENTSKQQAFDQLTGPDSRSSFKQYWEMLRDNGLATKEEVLDKMLGPGGLSEDTVRHELKAAFEPRVIHQVKVNSAGVPRTEAEAVVELRRLTANLNASDKGNLAEAWYASCHSELKAHPDMLPADNPNITELRRPDFVEGTTVVEVKSTRQGLSNNHDVPQITDVLNATKGGGVVRVEGAPRPVDKVRLVFTEVTGARGAVKALGKWLDDYAHLTVEIYGRAGARTTLTRDTLGDVMKQHGANTLKALLEAL